MWGSDPGSATPAAFNEELRDFISSCYEVGGRAAPILYTHGQINGVDSTTINFLFDYAESNTGVQVVNYKMIMDFLASRDFVDPSEVTVANGATVANEIAAAKYDSLKTADGVTWPNRVWVGPWGFGAVSGTDRGELPRVDSLKPELPESFQPYNKDTGQCQVLAPDRPLRQWK